MENPTASNLAKPLNSNSPTIKLMVIVAALTIVLGGVTGFIVARKNPSPTSLTNLTNGSTPPKSAGQDVRTFRDFSEGVVKTKPTSSAGYTEGTHILQRDNQTPVALTSSVVDLSQYEGKKVKVYGETQKAVTEGWLMDVGRVEEIK